MKRNEIAGLGPGKKTAVIMLIKKGGMDRDQLQQVADLHTKCLPDSMVSLLGRSYTVFAYRYFIRSIAELLFVQTAENRVLGVCLCSVKPASVARRLIFNTPLIVFALAAIFRVSWRRLILAFIESIFDKEVPANLTGAAEVVYIFTCATARNDGLGRKLLQEVERHFAKIRIDSYYIRTADHEDNLAIGFFEKSGFEKKSLGKIGGDSYLLMAKTSLSGPSRVQDDN